MQNLPQSKIGLLNDLHYDGGGEALNRLYESVAVLNRSGVEFLVVMGDLVDADNEMGAVRLLREVSALCNSFNGTVYYMLGNHDLDHLSKAQFFEALNAGGNTPAFSFTQGGIHFICLDGNFSPDGSEYNCGNFDWKDSFIPPAQIEWLEKQLASTLGPVLIFSHQRVDIACMHSVRNYEKVLNTIRKSGKVLAVFQGHQHADDLRKIEGTTYYTLSAHKEGAGPAVVHVGATSIRLMRDFQALEPA